MLPQDFPKDCLNRYLSPKMWEIKGGLTLEGFKSAQNKIPKALAGALRMLKTMPDGSFELWLQHERVIYKWALGVWEMDCENANGIAQDKLREVRDRRSRVSEYFKQERLTTLRNSHHDFPLPARLREMA